MIPMTGNAARSKLAFDVLNGKVKLLCARTINERERCKREQGHDGLCRAWLDPEETK